MTVLWISNKMRLMKRIFRLGLVLASAFALTNCAKEAVPQTPGAGDVTGVEGVVPFEIYASACDTKTANDGMSTVWEAGDQINVFHAEAGSTSYVSDNSFTISEDGLAEGLFLGTLTQELTAAAYDWYFFYPYSSYVKTPASKDSGYMVLGSKSNAVQTQNGNSNMAHIAGENYPMCAVVKNVAADQTPAAEMKHMTALVAVKVANNTNKAMTVVSAGIKASEPIIGTYYMDFTGEKVVYTPSGDQYVSNIATLEVVDGEEISAGSSATFYFAVKPFTAAAGSTLTIYVNGSQKTVNIAEETEFAAGKIKTINVPVERLQHKTSTSTDIQTHNFVVGDNATTSHRAYINGVDTRYVVMMGTEELEGYVTLKGKIADFINMNELGFYAASWTGKQGAITVDKLYVKLPSGTIATFLPMLGLSNPIEFTAEELAAMFSGQTGTEVDLDVLMFKPASAGMFSEDSKVHTLTILDEELHYYGITEEEVDAMVTGLGLGLTVEDLRALISGEGDIAGTIESLGFKEMIEGLVGALGFSYETAIQLIETVLPEIIEAEIAVTLRTVAEDHAGNTYDPRVAIWGMNIYFNE